MSFDYLDGTGPLLRAAPKADPALPAVPMVVVDLTWHADPLDVIGERVPSRVVLPFPDLNPCVDLPEVSIRRVAPDPKPKPSFKRKEPQVALGPLPSVGPMSVALASENLVTWFLERLPRHGAVEAIASDHAAFPRVLAAARAILATRVANPGTSPDVTWARLLHAAEHVIRRCALPREKAFVVLRSLPALASANDDDLRARIAEAMASGVSRAGDVRDEIVSTWEAEETERRKDEEREERERRRVTELIEVDLEAAGLCEFTSSEVNPFGARRLYRVGGVPIGDATIQVGYRAEAGDVAVFEARVRSEGTAMATRSERDQAMALPDELAMRLRALRLRQAGGRRYEAKDFPAVKLGIEERAALIAFKARAATLVHAVATNTTRSALAADQSELLLTLIVAFGGKVSLPVAIDHTQEALRSYVRASSQTRVYGLGGKVQDVPADERQWPSHLMHPEAVPRKILAALAIGAQWAWGELLRPVSPEMTRELREQIDPFGFERVVADAVGDSTEVRSAALYGRLFAEGRVASTTPAPAERARVSAALEHLGFVRGEGLDPEGKRCRVWRRAGATTVQGNAGAAGAGAAGVEADRGSPAS